MLNADEITKEIRNFLDALFIYHWTNSKDDLQKLICINFSLIKKELAGSSHTRTALEKYYLTIEQSESSNKRHSEIKEILPQISGIMLLREAIIEINKTQKNPIMTMSFEDIKAEYGYLRVKLLEDIKIRIVNKEYNDDIYNNDPLEASQKKVDQYEDKFHEISNWLGYQYLTYKNTTFYKWLFNNEHKDLIHSNILNSKDIIRDPREIN